MITKYKVFRINPIVNVPERFKKAIYSVFGSTLKDILKLGRGNNAPYIRGIIMVSLRNENWTLEAIGEAMGMHHSTVIHRIKKHKDLMQDGVFGEYKASYEAFQKELNG